MKIVKPLTLLRIVSDLCKILSKNFELLLCRSIEIHTTSSCHHFFLSGLEPQLKTQESRFNETTLLERGREI